MTHSGESRRKKTPPSHCHPQQNSQFPKLPRDRKRPTALQYPLRPMAPLLLFIPLTPQFGFYLPLTLRDPSLLTRPPLTFLYSFRFPYPYRQSPPLPDPTSSSPQLGLLGVNVLTAFVCSIESILSSAALAGSESPAGSKLSHLPSFPYLLGHPQLQVPSHVSLSLPPLSRHPPPAHASPGLPEDEVQAGAPESADENPAAAGPEEADAILAAPSPSAASLPLNPALPLLEVESSPRLFTEPAFCGPPPRPLGASLRLVRPAPGPAQGYTIRLAWGTTRVSHPLCNFNRFPRKLL